MNTFEARAIELLRAELSRENHRCRCYTCKGPATREVYAINQIRLIKASDEMLFCDEHVPDVVKGSNVTFMDLRGAAFSRKVIAFLKEYDNRDSPKEIDVDGIQDPNRDITYIGKATRMEDGTWRCLANVAGALCVVEVTVTFQSQKESASLFECSFCGKSSGECKYLVAGPCVNICDECVQVAAGIVEEHPQERTVKFVKHISTDGICPKCAFLIATSQESPWWSGTCLQHFTLDPHRKTCPKFETKPEFSGCRCPDCPERNGTGKCSCCEERRQEEQNPGPDPFV